MTRQEINAMEPGRRLDALVFLGVMGGANVTFDEHGDPVNAEAGYPVLGIPRYSEAVEQAWAVVSRLLAAGYDFECRSLMSRRFSFVFFNLNDMEPFIANGVGYVISDPLDEWQWPAEAETLPLAVCRAALILAESRKVKA